MKRLYHVISGLAGGVLLLAGCEGDTIVLDADPVAPEATTLSVTSDNPLYSAQEGRGTLRFKTPGGEVVFSPSRPMPRHGATPTTTRRGSQWSRTNTTVR